MVIKTIHLSQLEADPQGTLSECADSGEAFIIELPDRRRVAIQLLESTDEDSLTDELLATNAEFQALIARSNQSPRQPFPTASKP